LLTPCNSHHQWEVTLEADQAKHILCHCDTCKILSGGAYTMNQIIPKSALKITKGGEPSKYSYKGDSGTLTPTTIARQLCRSVKMLTSRMLQETP
jgi:hypothetical protein